MLLYLLIFCLCAPHVNGQILASNTSNIRPAFSTYTRSNFVAFRERPAPPPALLVIGGCSIGAGIGLVSYGLLVEYDAYSAANETTNQSQWQQGHTAIVAGCVVAAAGLGMCIAGGIQHYKRLHTGWGVIAPKWNEIGIAYNF